MRHKHLTGIVIKRINFNEADRMITLFSKNAGKIKIIGKGLRRITSKRAPHLEIFTQVNVLVNESYNKMPYITECQLINNFENLRGNINRIAIAFHLCEIIDKLLPDREKNEELYGYFLEALKKLENEKSNSILRQEIYLFINHLMVILGYLESGNKLSYTRLMGKIENTIEKPLNSLNLLKKLLSHVNN